MWFWAAIIPLQSQNSRIEKRKSQNLFEYRDMLILLIQSLSFIGGKLQLMFQLWTLIFIGCICTFKYL